MKLIQSKNKDKIIFECNKKSVVCWDSSYNQRNKILIKVFLKNKKIIYDTHIDYITIKMKGENDET